MTLPIAAAAAAASLVVAAVLVWGAPEALAAPGDFVTVWETTADNESITIPGMGTYTVDWGDGATSTDVSGPQTHEYADAGNHTVTTSEISQVFGNCQDSMQKLRSIEQWGDAGWINMYRAFCGATQMTYNATDVPDLSGVKSMSGMFRGASSFNGNVSGWDVSSVTVMTEMFRDASSFNGNVSGWDVSSVTDMRSMFSGASAFNQDLSNWNTSSVTRMFSMFSDASSFDGNVSEWDVSSVTGMRNMFVRATSFNQDLNDWNVSKVTDMASMFSGATSFNQNLNDWNVSKVTDMSIMFNGAAAFNQNLNDWNVSQVTDMDRMFSAAAAFNQDLNDWDVSKVTDMDVMFSGATSFNGDISSWNVSKVTDMSIMFNGAAAFNGNVSGWDVSNVTHMEDMFSFATSFNRDLNDWDVSNVTHMFSMFLGASAFDGNVSGWDVSQVTSMSDMFQGAVDFNGDLSSWNVSQVTHMSGMFLGASSFNQDISDWDVSQVTNMSDMFSDANSFDQNLGNWYVVPADTAYAASDVSLNVTTVSAQNSVLDGHSPTYGIGSRGDSASFNITDANTLVFNDTPSAGNHTVIVTASGDNVFENGNNWRELEITVTGAGPPADNNNPPVVDAGTDQTVGEGDTVTLSGSAADFDASDTIKYSWSAPSDSDITFANGSSASTTFTAPAVDGDATFTLTLTAGNGTDSRSDDVEVTVRETGSAFITTWRTTGANDRITIPGTGTYSVIWGDGSSDDASGSATHAYATPGTHTISITGGLKGISLAGSTANAQKLQSIEQWGGIEWTTMKTAFQGALNMEYNAPDVPDLSGVSDMDYMFSFTGAFDGDISGWNVSGATDMSHMFAAATAFNGNLSGWDVSQVTDMTGMFYGASSFNGNLSGWNVSQVDDMSFMFIVATSFNGDLSDWDVSKVTYMSQMFQSATSFNGDLSSWNVSKVTRMYNMFNNATSFNGDLSSWNVSKVTYMSGMFNRASSFNGDLSSWNVSKVTHMDLMFSGAAAFNQPLSGWDVSNVGHMDGMFSGATSFDQNLGNWYVVPKDTAYAVSEVTLAVTTVSAQNSVLDGHSFMYGIGSGGDYDLFAMTGNTLAFKDAPTARNYAVNVTASGSVFGGENNWSMLDIAVAETGADADRPFVTTWRTADAGDGITIPGTGTYAVSWGDDTYSYGASGSATHAYATPGNYTVSITGGLEGIHLSSDPANAQKLQSIEQWGGIEWTTMKTAFLGASNMVYDATDAPDLSGVADMSGMFFRASSLDGDLSGWDVSKVTDMNSMFRFATSFNGNVSGWDVSQVTDMYQMFQYATSFNQDLNDWNVSQVTDMRSMFSEATSFNGNVSSWNVSQMTDMRIMFSGAAAFNQDISGWDVSQMTDMSSMFSGAAAFNQDLSEWNVSQVTDMTGMFSGATSFNQPLSGWDVSQVTDMINMFRDATSFNQPLSGWDVSQVTDMINMFQNAAAFNQPLSGWDVSQVTAMRYMFDGAAAFNQDISGWNVSQVTDMSGMFTYTAAFNQPLSGWNVSQVTDMDSIFRNAAAFNQPLSEWDVSQVTDMDVMFYGASSFNQDISGWNVSQVTDMSGMFNRASSFDGNLSGWDVSQVTDMGSMFERAAAFNQPLSSWNVSQVTDMRHMFERAAAFNQPLSSWNVSQVTDMRHMFERASSFDGNLSGWDVSQVTYMGSMFERAAAFNQPLSSWNVSGVTYMSNMFREANSFQQNLGNWYVVPADTDYATSEGTLRVTTVLAQNSVLDGHSPTYGIGSEGDSALFAMDGNVLKFKNMPSVRSHTVNVTASGSDVFENGNNWRMLKITVTGGASNNPPEVDAGSDLVLAEGASLMLSGNATDQDAGDTLTYSWSQNPATPVVGLSNDTSLTPIITAPFVESSTVITLTLTVSDGTVYVTDAMNITVRDTAGAFITTWKTASADEEIRIPGTGTYDVVWGDGEFSDGASGSVTHVYDTPGTYTVSITGGLDRIRFSFPSTDAPKLQSIEQWGEIEWTTMQSAFRAAANMEYRATDAPDLSGVTNMNTMFFFASDFDGNLSGWDVSGVTDMSGMFHGASSFNGDLSGWDVSSVTDMISMFHNAGKFNKPLSGWNVSQVEDMSSMFLSARSFNQDLNDWDVSQVTDMGAMFQSAGKFNKPLSSWDVSQVTDMTNMFASAPAFRQNLGNWYVVPADTAYGISEGTLAVTTVSAQNSVLDGHSFMYGIGSGGDYDLFVMDENVLKFKDTPPVGNHTVNVTASGSLVFGGGGNWRELEITVAGADDPDRPFITTWETTSVNGSITIPGTGMYAVDWGDGTSGNASGSASHVYATSGNYTVSITGGLEGINLGDDSANARKLQSIGQWGEIEWTTMESAFNGAFNMVYNATDAPDLSRVADMSSMFQSADAFNGNISSWDVSKVTEMGNMFTGATSFNGNISSWDVSKVIGMGNMFIGATSFNGDLSGWDVSQVTEMDNMFRDATSFNQDLNDWNVSGVTDLSGMFHDATSFNQDLNDWSVSQVTEMGNMFTGATSFNGDLSGWDVSQATYMTSMFNGATSFDGDLSSWNVSQATYMDFMFSGATSFDGDLSSWNVSQATYMTSMFNGATSFDQNLGNWYVVPADTDYAASDVSLNVTTVSAQNSVLDGHSPVYDIGSGDDSALFNMNGSTLMFKDTPSARSHAVNVTASGSDVFENGNNWRMLKITVTGGASNNPPDVDAGEAQTVGEGDTVTLSGSAADPDSGDAIESYSWSAPPGSGITFANSSSASTTFTAPAVEAETTFTLTLTADDGTDSGSDDIAVTVRETGSAFITTWKTASADEEIRIPGTGTYDVVWGDGEFSDDVSGHALHAYDTPGNHTISITGDLERFRLNGNSANAPKLQSIEQWGDMEWITMKQAFWGASNMVYNADDAPDLSEVTDMSDMFTDATAFNGDLSDWDVSKVTGMTSMFDGATSFNQPLNDWDVSQVIGMNGMFSDATSFNQPLSSWDVSQVIGMGGMFSGATSFDQNLGNWYVVPADTAYAISEDTLAVTTVSTQNSVLNGHSREYGIGSGGESALFNMTGNALMFKDAPSVGRHPVNVTASGNLFGGGNNWRMLEITVVAAETPIDTTDPVITLNGPSTLTITAGTAYTEQGATCTDDTDGSLQVTITGTVDASALGTHTLAYTCTDYSGNESTATRQVRVVAAWSPEDNSPPNVNAGPDQTVGEGDTVTLSGLATDPDLGGAIESYSWSAPTGSGITFANSSSASTTFTAPAVEAETTFTLTLTADDGTDSGSDDIAVTVRETGSAFITTWRTASAGETITIPGTGPYSVIWGDGEFSDDASGSASHAYATPGTHTISITGGLRWINLADNLANAQKLQSIEQWGGIKWAAMVGSFQGASNMVYNADDAPDLSGVTDMTGMFRKASSFDGDLSRWDVSGVTDMSDMFTLASSFNGDVSGWDVSSVTDMTRMFLSASAFNGDVSGWDVSGATGMNFMFLGASDFDQNLGNWYVVPEDTAYGISEGTLNVTTVSAQNSFLDGHSPEYGIGSGGESALFNMTGNALMFKDAPSVGRHPVNVTASGSSVFGDGNSWRMLEIAVAGAGSPEGNNPPVVNAGTAQTVGEGDTVTLSGSAADPDSGDAIESYSWSAPPGSGIMFANSSSASTTFTAPAVEDTTTFTLTLTASDGTDSGSDSIDVTVRETGSAFVTTWRTTNANEEITIPGTGMYTVAWGDGSSDGASGSVSHAYATPGIHTVSITGDLERIRLAGSPANAQKLQSIGQWGDIEWTTMESAFRSASNMVYNATDAPDLSGVASMDRMFRGATSFNGDISSWNVSQVTDMEAMFFDATSFNGDISSWNVSKVADMSTMFNGATSFNGDISGWDVSNVTSMEAMFAFATSFNQDLNDWDVSNVTRMFSMFLDATSFNQDLNDWDVLNVTNMGSMFQNAYSFNQSLSEWDVSRVTGMNGMFWNAAAFNGDLSSWSVSQVTSMNNMFSGATSFNQDLNDWDVSQVTGMNNMFSGATSFDQNLGKWYVVPEDTAYGISEGTLNVTTVSAQNSFLDGHSPEYGIGSGDDSALFNMTGSTLMFKDAPSVGSHAVNVTASGGAVFRDGNHWRVLDVKVTESNQPPTVTISGASSINEGTSGTLTGAASDSDGTISSYSWSVDDTSTITITQGNSATLQYDASQVDSDTVVTFTLTVTDNDGATGSDTHVVTVTNVVANQPPTVTISGASSINEGTSGTLTGAASDSDGTISSYSWSVDDTSTITITQGNSATLQYDASQVDSDTVVTFTLTVTDNDGATGSDTHVVTVTNVVANQPPTVTISGASSINEGTSGTLTGAASDSDGTISSYSWSVDDTSTITITQGNSATLQYDASQVDSDTVVTFTLTVTDNDGATGSDTHVVTVTNVVANQPPTVTISGASSINEGTSGTLTGAASDSDGTISSYSWSVDDTSTITITQGNSATLRYDASRVDSDTAVTFTLTVTDNDGDTTSDTYAVTVRDVPPPPGTFDAVIAQPVSSPTNQDPVFDVTFGSPVPAGQFTTGDVSTSPPGLDVSVSGSGTSFSFTINDAPDGRITVHVPAGAVSDAGGDTNTASNRATVTVDKTDPRITSARVSGSDAITVSFSERVQGTTGASDWSLVGAPGVVVDSTTDLPSSSVTLDLSGDLPGDKPELTLSYSGSGIRDNVGNFLGADDAIVVRYPSDKSRGQSAPPVMDISSVIKSYPQSVPEWVIQAAGARDPKTPIPPIATNGTFAFPLEINSLGYLLDGPASTVVPAQVAAGQTVTISVAMYDATPIAYFAIYLHLQGNEISHLDSDAQVIWNNGDVYVIDPGSLMQDVTVTVSEDPDDPAKKTATVTFILSEGMGETNLVIRTWNAAGQLAEVRVFDAIAVTAPGTDPEPGVVDPEPGVVDPEPGVVDPEPTGIIDAVDPEPGAGDDSAGRDLLAIRMWSGFEPESISDAQLLATLGLDYPGADIPSWVMTKLGVLAAKGDVTAGEFRTALEYVLEAR